MTIKDIFDTMDYGPAPEDPTPALDWIARHKGQFGCFIDGAFQPAGELFDTRNPARDEVLAQVTQGGPADVDRAVAAARAALPGWSDLTGHQRARKIYALARLIQKHARLFAVLETLDNGKPIRESRDIDIPLAARHFYYHAGLAQLWPEEAPDRAPIGVCGQVIPWNFPLLMLAWKVAPALAAGNTVVLKPAEYTPLTALLFAEITQEAGLPKGVVNIVTGDGRTGAALVAHDGVDKLAFTGSTEVGREIRQASAGSGKGLTLELGGKSPFVVFDDADLDSAVEGVVDAIWFNAGQVCCAGARLLVQEPVADAFDAKLRARMAGLRLGDPLDKCIDLGAIVDPVQRDRIAGMVAGTDGTVFQPDTPLPNRGCFFPPTLITGLSPADPLMQDEIFGPVLVSTTFRTPDEAVALANDTRYGLAASVWSENIATALDVAPRIKAGVVWVNGTNMFDAAAPFGGMRESGFGREGGWDGMWAYSSPAAPAPDMARTTAPARPSAAMPADDLDRTLKHYVGGVQARPDSGYSTPVFGADGTLLGHAPDGNRKDIRNAVEAAGKARGWGDKPGHARAQVMFFLAENLSARSDDFTARIAALTGDADAARVEVDMAVSRLFTYAAWADKVDGRALDVPMRGLAVALRKPVGVIGAFCPDTLPLLGLVSCLGPAMAMGNPSILIPARHAPLAALDFVQVLECSDVPAGVVNIVTGDHAALAPHLAAHRDVDAVWSFSGAMISAEIERQAAGSLKRSWVNHGRGRDWTGTAGAGRDFLDAATEVQTIWVPAWA